MRLEGGSNCSVEEALLEPSASMNDLPSEVMKNIFSFVGKGNYCFIAPVSKDFCFNYLTFDLIEDKFAHKMDYLQAIGRNKITSAEAVSSSFELAEYCFFKAPEDFQKQVVMKAILKGKKDIVEMGDAMGIKLEETMNLVSREDNLFKIARKGDLEMLQFLDEKGVDIESDTSHIISAAAKNGQLQILMWLHENNLCESSVEQKIIFTTTIKSDLTTDIKLSVLKWAMDDAGFNCPSYLFNSTVESGNLEIVKYLRSKNMSWDDLTFNAAAGSGNIALLQYLLENDCPHDDPDICTDAVENDDNEKALEVLQWLHNQGIPWYEYTCTTIAKNGNLKALKYARLNNCPWNQQCLIEAIEHHHYEVVEFCLQNSCPLGNRDICRLALNDKDHDRALKMLKLLREFSVPWSATTCTVAAIAANFEALKWIISKGCPWDREGYSIYAAGHGNIEALKWMRSHGVAFDEMTFTTAVSNGHLETLKFLRSKDCPMGRNTLLQAISSKTFAIVEYCIENDFPFDERLYEYAIKDVPDPIPIIKLLRNSGYHWHPSACTQAAMNGDLKLLRWLRYNGCPWDESVCNEAVKTDNLKILKYAHENGCPWTKETYAYCFADGGLDELVGEIPTLYQCSVGIIRYLHKHNCPKPDPTDWSVVRLRRLSYSGNIELLQYLLENECPRGDRRICICTSAVENNDHEKALEVLQWLHSQGNSWNAATFTTAAKEGNLEALKYMKTSGCEWNEECLNKIVQFRNIELVAFCLQNGCPIGNSDLCSIAMNDEDHDRALKILKVLREFSVPWTRDTCRQAARAGNFTALKWCVCLGCPWDRQSCAWYAAEHGDIEVLKWMKSKGCEWDEEIGVIAAKKGHVETLKYLISDGCPWNEEAFIDDAIESGNFAMVEYCVNNDPFLSAPTKAPTKSPTSAPTSSPTKAPTSSPTKTPVTKAPVTKAPVTKAPTKPGIKQHPLDELACTQAARQGDLKLLRWLRFQGFPWDEKTCNEAVKHNNLDILKYAHENGCEWTKDTYAYSLSEFGLNYNTEEIPTHCICKDEIIEYLHKQNCPKPDPDDWWEFYGEWLGDY